MGVDLGLYVQSPIRVNALKVDGSVNLGFSGVSESVPGHGADRRRGWREGAGIIQMFYTD